MLIEIVFNYIKNYFEKKNAWIFLLHDLLVANLSCVTIVNERDKNEFEILNVSNESYLLFCFYITMFALLFANQAFVFFLISSKHLFRFRIASKQKQLLMLFKKKLTKRSLFRRYKNSVKSVQIFEETTLIDIIFRSQMINLEMIIDMKLSTKSYTFRRDNEQVFDNSNKWILIFDWLILTRSLTELRTRSETLFCNITAFSSFKKITSRNIYSTLRPLIAN